MAYLTLYDAHRLAAKDRPWTFRMEYVGYNGANASGTSSKFWLATGRGLAEPVEIHYGALGSKGTILVKDFAYLAKKVKDKIRKGYLYADTPFVRVRQATIAAFVSAPGVSALRPVPKPKPATSPVRAQWRHHAAGVRIQFKPLQNLSVLTFDQYPATWQTTQDFGQFPEDLKVEVKRLRLKHGLLSKRASLTTWKTREVFHIHTGNVHLYRDLCTWMEGLTLGALKGPVAPTTKPAPGLTGPYAKVTTVQRVAKDQWSAVNAAGKRVMSLTAQGARDLVGTFDHITVSGLGV